MTDAEFARLRYADKRSRYDQARIDAEFARRAAPREQAERERRERELANRPEREQTADEIIRAYTSEFTWIAPKLYNTVELAVVEHYLKQITPLVSAFGSKFTEGNDPVATAPLARVLLERWDEDDWDLHFAMYSSREEVRCVKNNPTPYDLTFGIAAYDLDFDKHVGRPTLGNFADLVRTLWLLDQVPNVVYSTRGGARIVYYIEPMYDPMQFEQHYQRLMEIIAEPLKCGGCPYQVDLTAKDWTRLFRAPFVLRDGEPTESRVRMYHDDLIDLTKFAVKPKKVYAKPTGNRKFTAFCPVLQRQLKQIVQGQRNTKLFSAFAFAFEHFDAESAQKRIDILTEAAIEAGLDQREIDSTLRSARNHTNKGN
jgi:hypothetical protein